MRRYAHLGTGNYNTTTARVYTDVSLLTADPEITGAVHDVFSFLTAYAEHPSYEPLMVAPLDLAEHCLALIAREAEHARHGRPAHIIAKMNALLDKNVIMALYRASQAGVKIDLIVRGMCALRPGVRGVSDHIRVRSVVGRFLEHSRIFYFANGGEEEVYLGSADWMPRNLYERVEVIFPVNRKSERPPEGGRSSVQHAAESRYGRTTVTQLLLFCGLASGHRIWTQFVSVFEGGIGLTNPVTVKTAGIGGGCLLVDNRRFDPVSVWVQNGGTVTVTFVSSGGRTSLIWIGMHPGQSIEGGVTFAVIV